MSPASDCLLAVDDLTVEFTTDDGVVRAVDGVTFAIRPRETLAIVGESGSGKSVTSLAIMGLLPRPRGRVARGTIDFSPGNGLTHRLSTASDAEMLKLRGADIAMIFQEPMTSLNPVFRVGDQIAEAMIVHGRLTSKQALRSAIELLDLVGIPDPVNRVRAYPHQLSGGMRQRVMIAMALSCHPKLLIADEPTTALDVTIQAQILDLIARLQRQFGMAVLFITHDLGVVAEVADRVLVMYAGRIVEQADVKGVLSSPAHPYAQGLLRSIPQIDVGDGPRRRIRPIPGAMPDPAAPPSGCAFHPRCTFRRDGLCNVAGSPPPLDWLNAGHAVRCLRARDPEVQADAHAVA